MPLTESESHFAIGIWALMWLPGLFFASWRAEHNLRANRRTRALIELVVLLTIPVLAFGLYAVSDAQRYAQAHSTVISFGAWLSVAHVGVPYVVSAAYLFFVVRPGVAISKRRNWLTAAFAGLVVVLVLAPTLFMTQLMVLLGN